MKVSKAIEITKEIYEKYKSGIPSWAQEEVYGRIAKMVFIYNPYVYKSMDGKYFASYSYYDWQNETNMIIYNY